MLDSQRTRVEETLTGIAATGRDLLQAPRQVRILEYLTEAWRTDEEFGDERLVAMAHANRALEPGALLETLLAAVREFSGEAVPTDDVTLAILRVR